jgi:membrane-associated protease RseP (regulator of RpoE activity)
MENDTRDEIDVVHNSSGRDTIIIAQVVPEPPVTVRPRFVYPRRRVYLPISLFVATCASTYFSYKWWQASSAMEALTYALSIMTILLCHEAGHFIQTLRYRVYASLPFFIPMPGSPIGTLGAVIGMEARVGNRKAVFDIGISGPLAGLVPTLLFTALGLLYSHYQPPAAFSSSELTIQAPLVFEWIEHWIKGPAPLDQVLELHPMAFAGWVGLLITSLNLMPVGQLDGGHILYSLLRRRAHTVAWLFLMSAIAAMIVFRLPEWTVMIILLLFMGPRHPPTADDDVPLGAARIVLGWLTLAFVVVSFTPRPM